MVLKCFNLPSSQPPNRGSGKERIQVKWTCLEMVPWRKSCLHCQEISSSVHWSAVAAPLENTSWMHQQSSSVVSGEQQQWPGLSLSTSQQKEPEVLSCASQWNENMQDCWVLYILPPNIVRPWVWCPHVSCLSMWVCISWHDCQSTQVVEFARSHQNTARFLVFLSLESWQMAHNDTCEANQYMCYYKESFITCPFACFCSKTSFHLCPLQWNAPPSVCFSKTPSNTTDFPKNP